MKKNVRLLFFFAIALAVLAACTPQVVTETVIETVVVEKEIEGETVTVVETVEVVREVVVTEEPEAMGITRADTVIFDLDRFLADNSNANPYSPAGVSGFRLAGGHQILWEPLFILNPISGEIQPWLGTEL